MPRLLGGIPWRIIGWQNLCIRVDGGTYGSLRSYFSRRWGHIMYVFEVMKLGVLGEL